MDELKLDETTSTLIKITQDKDLDVTAVSRKNGGFDTSAKLLLEIINSRIVEIQVSSAGSNFVSYEINVGKLARRINLLECR